MSKKRDGGSVKVKITDGGSLKDLGKNAKKAGKDVGSVAKNVQESDRRLKSLSQQTSNSTKAFSKQAQTIGGGLVPIYATIAAQVFAVTAAFRFLQEAMETRNMIEGQKAFGAITGNAFSTMTMAVQQATANMISFKEAASAVAIGTAAGLTRGQLEQLGTAAKNASLALGRDVTDAFNRLIRGVTKAEPELLDELGIILRLEPATEKYAMAIGKARTELTAFERSQAVANEVISQAETKFGRITEIMDENAFVLGQFAKEFDDLTKIIKTGVADFLIPIISFLKDNVRALIGVFGLLIAPIVTQLMPNFGAMADKMSDVSKASSAMAKNLKKDASMIKNLQKDGKLTGEGIKQFSKSGREGMQGMLSGLDLSGESKTMQKAAMGKKLNAQELGVLKRHLKQKGHLLSKFNAEERAKFDRYIKHQELALKGSLGKAKLEYKQLGITTNATFAGMKAGGASFFSGITKGAALAGRAVSGLLSAFGWISIAFIAFDALKNMFSKTEEEMTKAQKRAHEFGEQLKELNTELGNMNRVRQSGFVIGGLAQLEQQANALKTGDAFNLMKEFNKELRTGTLDAEQQSLYVASAKQLEKLVPQMKGFHTLFLGAINDIKTIDLTEKNAFVTIANDIMKAGLALAQFTAQMETLDKARLGIVQGARARPYAGLIGNLATILGEDGSLGQNTIDALQAAQDQSVDEFKLREKAFKEVQNYLYTQRSTPITYSQAEAAQKDYDGLTIDETREAQRKQFTGLKNTLINSEFGRQAIQDAFDLENADIVDPEAAAESLTKQFFADDGRILQDKFAKSFKKLYRTMKSDGTTTAELELQFEQLEASQEEINRRKELARINKTFMKALQDESKNTIALQERIHKGKLQDLENTLLIGREEIAQAKIISAERNKQNAITKAEIELRIAQKLFDEEHATASTENKARLEDQLQLAKDNLEVSKKELEIQKEISFLKFRQYQESTRDMQDRFDNGSFFSSFVNRRNQFMQGSMATEAIAGAERAGMMSARSAELQGNPYADLASIDAAGMEGARAGREQMIQQLHKEFEAREKITRQLKLQNDISTRLTEGLANDMANALVSVAQGTKTMKQAFGDMAVSIIADITKMIIKQMILNALMAMVGMINPGAAAAFGTMAGLPTGRVGGIMTPGAGDGYRSYRSGGVADGPDSGYQATLHGTEAVVPLGNDREIPVKMLNAGGGNMTANVTVNMSDGGSSVDVQTEGEKAKAFANGISAAVQQEIVKQQRAGGLLSSY